MNFSVGGLIITGLLIFIPVAAIRSFYLDYKERKEKKAQQAEQN